MIVQKVNHRIWLPLFFVVIVLSQRYGPSLAKAGFGDYSATHLEYLRALERRKPVYMYVRDRLEADYAIWKKAKNKEEERKSSEGRQLNGSFS